MNPPSNLFGQSRISQLVVDRSPYAVVIASGDGAILYTNEKVESWFGYAPGEIDGRLIDGVLPGLIYCAQDAQGVRRGSQPTVQTCCCQMVECRDGEQILMRATLDYVQEGSDRLIIATLDHPRTPSVDPHVIESERLDAVATMIRGLAHESRNALQRAVACLDLLELDLSDDARQLELSGKIRASLSDLLENYDEVKRFAEPIHLNRQLVDLKQICDEAIEKVTQDRLPNGEDCQVSSLAQLDAFASIDREKVINVVVQLLQNATDAPGSPRKITVSCDPVLSQGRSYHRLSVEDDGDGFSDAALCRAFEPFFTTKQQGSGLGLSISRRIILAHDGAIRVYNTKPRGAMAEVLLPAADA